jgi:DNA-binding LacI/PurR family transcriptional regulator
MSISLPQSPLKHHSIAAELRTVVGSLAPMTRLPPERALAERFACSVLTVRKGLAHLVREGRILRRPGSGTFVAPRSSGVQEPVAPLRGEPGVQRIGLLMQTDTGSYGHRVIQAVGQAAMAAKVSVSTAWVTAFKQGALEHAASMAKSGCTALVLPWFAHERTGEVADFVRACPLPVILPLLIPGLERNCFERPDRFGVTTLTGVEALCHYFRRLGYTRLALLGPDEPSDPLLQARLSAYTCFTHRAGLEATFGLIPASAEAADALATRWQQWCGNLAIISYDDTHALRLMTAMHKLGRSAPTDFAILGFNNIEASLTSDPPLSTVCQDYDYIGQALLESALALARGEVRQSATPPAPRLLVRASCGGAERLDAALLAELAEHGLTLTAETTSVPALR